MYVFHFVNVTCNLYLKQTLLLSLLSLKNNPIFRIFLYVAVRNHYLLHYFTFLWLLNFCSSRWWVAKGKGHILITTIALYFNLVTHPWVSWSTLPIYLFPASNHITQFARHIHNISVNKNLLFGVRHSRYGSLAFLFTRCMILHKCV